MRALAVALLLCPAPRAQDPGAEALALLRSEPAVERTVLATFAARVDAPRALPELVTALSESRVDPARLDELLAAIVHAHPAAQCSLEPLVEMLARRDWRARHQAASALRALLRPDLAAAQQERLARSLVPLLVSQRGNTRAVAGDALGKLGGSGPGRDAAAARAWFHQRFRKGIDLLLGVHERVVVVREAGSGFTVDGTHVADLAAAVAAVQAARDEAVARGLTFHTLLRGEAASVGPDPRIAPIVNALAAASGGSVELASAERFWPPFAEDEAAIAPLRASLQLALDTRMNDVAPGVQAAVVLPDGRSIALATGVADRDAKPPPPMPVHGRLLAGSTGKTFFAALALQLVREQKLSLDQRVATWFGDEPWFTRLANSKDVTVRHLMQHRSGLVRYEFQNTFVAALNERPDHRFTPREELAFVPDAPARFAAGEGFEYSDTNYVLLGLVLERVTGTPNYDEIARRFLVPLALRDTVPGVGRRIPGLVQGHAGANNPFGRRDAMLQDGELPFDAGFEGAGGGFASSAADLARWAKHLYEGDVLDGVREQALAGVPAPLGKDTSYGLGVIVDPTPLGPSWGHRGFFPGWRSDMRYFPELQIAVAVLANTSAGPRVGTALRELTIELARVAAGR